MIEFFCDVDEVDFERLEAINPVVEKVLSDHDFKLVYENIILISDDELLEINREFLKHDYYTDIITFNYAEEPMIVEAELYISLDRVRENATQHSVDFYNELFRVIMHGNLHLVGMKDDTVESKKSMQSFENQYVNMVCSTWNV